jgi:hypothetical protein
VNVGAFAFIALSRARLNFARAAGSFFFGMVYI